MQNSMYEKTLKLIQLHNEKARHKGVNNTYYNDKYSFSNDAIRVACDGGWHILFLYNNEFEIELYTHGYMLESFKDEKMFKLLEYSHFRTLHEIPHSTEFSPDDYFQLSVLYPDIEMLHKIAMQFHEKKSGISIDFEKFDDHIDTVLDILENDPVLEAWSRVT